MGSINIRFDDEYSGETTYRNKFVNVLNSILLEEAEIFGTKVTISLTSNKKYQYQFLYTSGKFQTPAINELNKCSELLNSLNKNHPKGLTIGRQNE